MNPSIGSTLTVLYVGEPERVGQLWGAFVDSGVAVPTIVIHPDTFDFERPLPTLDVDGIIVAPASSDTVADLSGIEVPIVVAGGELETTPDQPNVQMLATDHIPAVVKAFLDLLDGESYPAELKEAARTLAHPFVATDADGTVKLWDSRATETFDWAGADIADDQLPVLTPEQLDDLIAALDGQETVERTYLLTTASGRNTVGNVRATAIGDESDQVALSFESDSKSGYERTLTLLPNPVVAHRDGEIVAANEGAANLVHAVDVSDLVALEFGQLFEDEPPARDRYLDDDTTDSHHRLRCLDGTTRFVNTTSQAVVDEEGAVTLTAFEDITGLRMYQEGLAGIQEQTQALLGSTTTEEAIAMVVATTQDIFGVDDVQYYAYDDANQFLPRPEPGDSEAVEPVDFDADTPLRDAFATGAVVPYTTVDDTAAVPICPGIALPLGNIGVLLVGESDTAPTDIQRQLATVVAKNLETIFDRLRRDEEIRARDERLSEQNEQLKRLNRINGIIRGLNRALLEATTRNDIQRAVHERLTGADPYRFSWFVQYDPLTETVAVEGDVRVETSVTAAVGQEGSPVTDLVWACIEEREVQVATELLDDAAWREHRQDVLAHEYRSIAAVPIAFREAVDGVLVVHLRPASGLNDRELTVLGELGELVGQAVDIVERSNSDLTNSGVELELELGGQGFLLNRLAETLDGEITVEGAVIRDDRQLLFVTIESDTDVKSVLSSESQLTSFEMLDSEGTTHSVRLAGPIPHLTETLLNLDAKLVDLQARSGRSVATIRVAQNGDVRRFVEELRETYPSVQLRTRQAVSTPVETAGTVRARFEERSSERQQEAIELAYEGGYYEWPRKTSGGDLAELLGVSSPTLQYHLRAAEQKAVELILDGSYK